MKFHAGWYLLFVFSIGCTAESDSTSTVNPLGGAAPPESGQENESTEESETSSEQETSPTDPEENEPGETEAMEGTSDSTEREEQNPTMDAAYGVGIARIHTNGEEVDFQDDDRPWVNITLEFVEALAGEQVGPDSPATWTGFGAIHLRGNSSTGYEKKQYALETRDQAGEDVDVSVFGLPEEEDFVLAGPYSDKTLMRNHLMFKWSRAIGHYAPRTRFVELYMETDDGEVGPEDYRGVYVLTEKIKRDKNRVAIEKLGAEDNQLPELSGGYLMKRDWVEEEPLETEVYGDEILLLYPKPEEVTDDQRDYIEGYLNSFEEALVASDGSSGNIADLESFADHMLMMEMSRNVDAYVLSTYMHKSRDGKLAMGPIWDFNGSLGNADYFESWETVGWHYENPEFPGDNPQGFKWYEALLKTKEFQDLLATRWTAHRQGPWSTTALHQDIDDTATLLQEAQERNFEKWPILGEYVWPNDSGHEERTTYQEEIDYLKNWIADRCDWLDTQWSKAP